MTYTYCCVYSARLLMIDRQPVRNMYSFIPKNKYEKLVHLVAFIIRIYHDARSPERQILYLFFVGDNRSLKCHISRYTFVGQAPILDGLPHVINRNLQHWVCFTGGPAAISARKLSKYFSSPASSPTLLKRNKPYFLEEHLFLNFTINYMPQSSATLRGTATLLSLLSQLDSSPYFPPYS
jgi:hypothetical protein